MKCEKRHLINSDYKVNAETEKVDALKCQSETTTESKLKRQN